MYRALRNIRKSLESSAKHDTNRFAGVSKKVKSPLQLVLVTPEIPANTGNIVRLCAATSVPLHLVEPLGFCMDDRLLKRAGLDYWKHCAIHNHLTFENIEREFKDARFLFLSARATRSFYDLEVHPGDFIVMGPESTGLSNHFLARGTRRQNTFQIPMPGEARSLNLATAAGIVIYEALRQIGRLDRSR
jgi:tRNA (cytidine/uridine-2'-O-)-methyltransferase